MRERRSSLARRIWWTLVATVLVAVAGAGIAAWLAARSLLLAETDESLQRRAERYARFRPAALHAARGRETWRGGTILARLGAPGADAIARSEGWPQGLPEQLAVDDLVVAADAADGRAFRLVQVALPPEDDEPRSRWRRRDDEGWSSDVRLVLAFDVSGLHADLLRLAWLLIGTSAAAVALAALAAGRLRDGLLAPLRRLGGAIDALPPQDLDARIAAGTLPAELDQIRERIDLLLERLAVLRLRERRTVADIAHELRTPLAALRSELGFAHGADDAAARLPGLEREVGALQERVEGLLLLSRFDAGAQQMRSAPLPFADAIADAWAPLAARARECGCRLELADPGEATLEGDPALLAILFGNLLGNALAHGAGGVIGVRAEHRDGRWRCSVVNPTIGLEPGDRSMAFEAFWREDRARSGGGEHSGLGLAVAQRIADAHGAEIRARVDGDGRFIVELDWP